MVKFTIIFLSLALFLCTKVNASDRQPFIDNAFRNAMLLSESGEYERAIHNLEVILNYDSTLVRPRLELARILALDDQIEAAKEQYDIVLNQPLPFSVRQNVLAALAEVSDALPKFSFDLDLVQDSNPTQIADSNIVLINGIPFILNTPTKKASIGMKYQINAELPLNTANGLTLSLTSYNEDYEASEIDFREVRGGFKLKRYFIGKNKFTPELGLHSSRYGGKSLYNGFYLNSSIQRKLSDNLYSETMTSVKTLNYKSHSDYDGESLTLSERLTYVTSNLNRVSFEAVTGRNNTKSEFYSHDLYGNTLSIKRMFNASLDATFSYSQLRKKYKASSTLFVLKRSDSQRTLSLYLTSPKVTYKGFSPSLTLRRIKADSNISLYKWSSNTLTLGIKKQI